MNDSGTRDASIIQLGDLIDGSILGQGDVHTIAISVRELLTITQCPAAWRRYDLYLFRDEQDLWLVLATWFALAAPQIAAIDALEQKRVSHACELETSMILHLRPELVRLEDARGATRPSSSEFSGRVTVRRPFEHTSVTGALGHPELATPEKGEELFAVAVEQVVACIRDVATWQAPEPS